MAIIINSITAYRIAAKEEENSRVSVGKSACDAPHEEAFRRDQSQRAQKPRTDDDVLFVGKLKSRGDNRVAFLIMVGVPFALMFIVQRLTGEPIWESILYILPFMYTYLREVDDVKRVRYIIRKSGLEWVTPGLSGGLDRIVAEWDDILWIGPLPKERDARKELEGKFKLSPGRIRSIPATASVEETTWRVIRRGKRLTHAVDFFPSPEYLDAMHATAPAQLFDSGGSRPDNVD